MLSFQSFAAKVSHAASVVGAQISKFAKDPVSHVRRGFLTAKSEALLFKELLKLSPTEMQDAVAHLNEIMQVLCFGNGELVMFHLKYFSPDVPLWQKSVRIACYKVNCRDRSAKITRTLNLRQFWTIRHEILEQTQFRLTKNEPTDFREEAERAEAISAPTSNTASNAPITAVTVLNRVDEASELEECCICMEKTYEVSLPCAHSFCKACIESWNDTHSTCPMCRNQISSENEFWEFEEAPNQEEFGQYVLRLAAGS